MSTIAFACTQCRQTYQVSVNQAGKRTRCPACGQKWASPRTERTDREPDSTDVAPWQRYLLAPLGWFRQYPPGILVLAVVVYLTLLFIGSYWYFRSPPDFPTATTNFQKYLEATGDWYAIVWEQWDPSQDRYVVTASFRFEGQHRKARLSASKDAVTVSLYEPTDPLLLGYHPKTITYQFEGYRPLPRVVTGQPALSDAPRSQQRLQTVADHMAAAFRKAMR